MTAAGEVRPRCDAVDRCTNMRLAMQKVKGGVLEEMATMDMRTGELIGFMPVLRLKGNRTGAMSFCPWCGNKLQPIHPSRGADRHERTNHAGGGR